MNNVFKLFLLLLCLSWGTLSAQSMFPYVPADKVDPEVAAHQQDKSRLAVKYAGKSTEEYQAAFLEKGLNPNLMNAEECALYVEAPLSASEISKLAGKGIAVHPTYVPPVPGHHPYGFYLSTVDYSALDTVRNDDRFVLLTSTEMASQPQNDQAAVVTNVDDVHAGNGITARDGTGIVIAIADSGIDLTHNDFPTPIESYDMTDGTSTADWGASVANTVSDHGTHVTGIALGRGTDSGGTYVGAAPGASLAFYKIGNDATASASSTDEIEAMNRAVAIGADIFSMSYGGTTTYMDGSDSHCQAADAAMAAGVLVFISAGNEADNAEHDSVSVAPGGTSGAIGFTVDNSASGSTYTTEEWIRVIWIDDTAGDANVTMSCTNLGAGETFVQGFSGASSRGTDAKRYVLTPNIGAGGSKTYTFTLSNTAGSGSTPLIHLYQVSGKGAFDSPDPTYTTSAPALADNAIAVGAYVHRTNWTNYQGTGYMTGETLGTRSSFSSRGPRVDGTQKPQFLAPGAINISTRDSVLSNSDPFIIDNDGLNLNGSGPATYYLKSGTSMACPWAAGVAALILEENPGATPAQVLAGLTSTASKSGAPDTDDGYGLIDALAAAQTTVPVEVSGYAID